MIRALLIALCAAVLAAPAHGMQMIGFGAGVSDDFNRTDASPIGAPWVQLDSNTGVIKIVSNQAASSTGDSIAYYGGVSFTSDQFAQVTIASAATALENGGPVVRAQNSSGSNGYVLFVTDPTTAKLFKVVAGSWTQLTPDCTNTFTQGDVLRLEASGTTLTPYKNGVALSGCSRTDAALSGGSPGIYIDGTEWRLDDFLGGNQ